MSEEGRFLIYCIEEYKNTKRINGKKTIELFKQYDVMDYIMSCFGALHTTGSRYIVEDIDLFIAARQ